MRVGDRVIIKKTEIATHAGYARFLTERLDPNKPLTGIVHNLDNAPQNIVVEMPNTDFISQCGMGYNVFQESDLEVIKWLIQFTTQTHIRGFI